MSNAFLPRFSSHSFFVVLLLLVGCGLIAPVAAADAIRVFEDLGDRRTSGNLLQADATGAEIYDARRMRAVGLHEALADESRIDVGSTLVLDLFDGIEHEAIVDRIVTDINGVTTVRARIEGEASAYALFSSSGRRTAARIELPTLGESYRVYRHSGAGSHVLIERRAQDPLDCMTCASPQWCDLPAETLPRLFDEADDPLEHVVVDIMVVYTPRADDIADQHLSGIHNVIAQSVEYTNLVLENSNTFAELNLVHSSEWDYVEKTCEDDLHALELHSDIRFRRDAVAADFVAMIGVLSGCGGMATYGRGFSVNQVGNDSVFAHELGHNFGAGHHLQQNFQPGPGLRSFAAGWRWTGEAGARYCTIMTYPWGQYFADGLDHSWVPHYSNPDVQHEGFSTGHASDGDNARTIREFKHARAAFREPVPQPETFDSPALVEGECWGFLGNNHDADKEPDEPDHAGNAGGASLWFEWTAPLDGEVTFTTQRSTIRTLLAVYTGSELSDLAPVASDAGTESGPAYSEVAFHAEGGTTYRVAVDGFDGARGMIALGWCYPGSLLAWGQEASGQMQVPPPNIDFITAAAGASHSLGVKSDGSVVGWGTNATGQLNVPEPNADFIAVAAGGTDSIGLRADGTVATWGGVIGQTPIPDPNEGFIAVAAGNAHMLGLRFDGTVAAWGQNTAGQTNVPTPNNYVQIAAAASHSLALRPNGSIVGWGSNTFGQLSVPSPNEDFVAVATGLWHSMGLKADGSIVVWGNNSLDQLLIPEPNEGFVAIATANFTCHGMRADGSVVKWGWIGTGSTRQPPPNANFSRIFAGGTHSFGLNRGTAVDSGWLHVTVEPAGAIASGAQWRIVGTEAWRSVGLRGGLPEGEHDVEFRDVPGWAPPENATVTVVAGEVEFLTAEYAEDDSQPSLWIID